MNTFEPLPPLPRQNSWILPPPKKWSSACRKEVTVFGQNRPFFLVQIVFRQFCLWFNPGLSVIYHFMHVWTSDRPNFIMIVKLWHRQMELSKSILNPVLKTKDVRHYFIFFKQQKVTSLIYIGAVHFYMWGEKWLRYLYFDYRGKTGKNSNFMITKFKLKYRPWWSWKKRQVKRHRKFWLKKLTYVFRSVGGAGWIMRMQKKFREKKQHLRRN